jgi:hypothetical protein
MPNTVFFSWQVDRPPRECRNFIERALQRAVIRIGEDTAIEEAVRELKVDQDTKGVPGSPPIVETIFRKIDKAAIFVPDLTFVGMRADGRPTPNPNVLIEYGWALKSLTNTRIVPVMNIAFGAPSAESMPFDMRHLRNPITYNCPNDLTDDARRQVRERLTVELERALRTVFDSDEFKRTLPKPPPEPSAFPLFPVDLLFVSRHTSTSEMLEAFFAKHPGYELIPEETGYMGFIPWFDSRVPYNEKGVARKSYCMIKDNLPALTRLTLEVGESPIKLPVRLTVQIYLPSQEIPSLILSACDTLSDDSLTYLELMDDMVFQHAKFDEWEVTNPSKRAWHVTDLRGARLRIQFKYIFFDSINLERPPYVNDLHLCFGRVPTNTLYFTTAQLNSQSWIEDSEDASTNAINENCKMKSLVLDVNIENKTYLEQIVQLAERRHQG